MRRHASTEASTKTHTANDAELPDLSVSWKFVAQAWLNEVSADSICHTFELGGTIAALGDVAFVRNGITVSFLLHDVLERKLSVVQLVEDSRPRPNHLSLASRTNLVKLFGHTAPDVVSVIYRRVRVRVPSEASVPCSRATTVWCSFACGQARTALVAVASVMKKQKRVGSEIDERGCSAHRGDSMQTR